MELILKALRFLSRGGKSGQETFIRLAGLVVIVIAVSVFTLIRRDQPASPPVSAPLPARGEVTLLGAIPFGGTVSGTLGQDERHGWQFQGEAGRVVNLRVRGDVDSTLEIIAPDWPDPIAIDFNSGGRFHAFLCAHRLTSNGTYTAVVSSYLGQAERATGDYELSLEAQEYSESIPIAPGETVTGRVDTCDGDFYVLDAEEGDMFEVTVVPEEGASIYARLLPAREWGDALAVSRETTDASGRTIDTLTAMASATRRLYLNIVRPVDAPDADYSLIVERR